MAGTNPRAVRVAGLIQRVVATALQRDLRDPRLAHVTITEVRVTNDLQIARIYWTYLGDDGHERGQRKRAKQALQQSAGRLRSMVGRKAGLRLTPQLQFIYDEVPAEATEVEDVLTVALKRDQELAKLRENATYAGDADPYRHDDERKGADSADSDDSEGVDGAYGAGYGDYDDDGEYDDSDVDFPDDDEDIDDDDDTADDASAGDGDSAR
ncbi:ribosome-binding factor A [Pseudoscardovia radai]|uniref:Ribosome-binding factor A n=1 Tax=Pseudoscardovia radai TaxID=987066 RepID=A0A261ESF9_9BIFI|nr:30S ribosome-binding factor RbfA [Pseudoscardovia radai]OZG49797.1 ribosome-binding factor A [Pseudoscardovia radai]